jgi:glycosyltransferase involved in cell wall biosynthesis
MRVITQPPNLEDYLSTASRRIDAGPRRRVSVVTICLNACSTIGKTIDSVQAQSFADIEYIVVDGGSTDGTQQYVESRLRPGDFLLSEPDRGISDAFNKGVALARGELIQFINADDWLSENQIETAVAVLDRTHADFTFGDLIFYEGGAPSFRYRGDPDYASKLFTHLPAMNHPTVLARRSAYEQIGLFSLEYRCAMEYDWFQRLHRAGGHGVYDPGIQGHMVHEGVSNRQYKRTFAEVRSISIKYGRFSLAARFDEMIRLTKVRTSFLIRQRSDRIYRFARRAINRSYKSL